MQSNIIIIDDFYSNPDLVRNFALSQSFDILGNYPGSRTTSFLTEDVKNIIQRIVMPHGGNITEWFTQDGFSGSFHIDTSRDRGIIHIDPFNTWGGICYLTPNAPPTGGLGIYRHRATGNYFADDKPYEFQDVTKWDLIDVIANKYNRLVLYKNKMFHSNMDYFGSGPEDGRLAQLFFFNTEF